MAAKSKCHFLWHATDKNIQPITSLESKSCFLTMAHEANDEVNAKPRRTRKPMFEEGWEDTIETTMSAATAHKQASRDAARLQKQNSKVSSKYNTIDINYERVSYLFNYNENVC